MRTVLLALALLLPQARASAQYVEARSLAATPHVLYLGTSAGAIYSSKDDGRTWQGFTQFRKDYVIDRMLVDGDHFYVAGWVLDRPDQGSLFVSDDAGKTWTLTFNKSIRAIGVSGDTLVVGALDGVYRSRDFGRTFEPISTGIKDIQSIAIDPENPSYLFIGTWHLGYYSHNGGSTWHAIAKGIINDSDFFTIVLDGSTVYIGACSGIYKGSDDGQQYVKEKTQTEARRTKIIRQVSKTTLYAGTTDGVWVTTDAGKTWKRRGSRYITVNDMVATSPGHIVVATLHHAVIWSDDGGKTYTESQF
jgi:photosystem II stability/assembly factor-like uncharacterized protein